MKMAGTMIEYTANGGKAAGYLAEAKTGKGVIVIQEWWGLAPHIKDVADRFAGAGFTALAPDLWDGKLATSPDEAGRMLMALNIDEAEKKIRGAVAALRAHGVTGKVGVVGFCMGGQLALYAATKLPDDIGACVNFYGIHPKVQPDYPRLKAPVLGIFGEKDPMVTPDAARQIEASIKKAGGRCEIRLYPAGHAFFNDTRKDVHDPTCAADAWKRTTEFFAANL
jgi:carboxymethylenebutenolidase